MGKKANHRLRKNYIIQHWSTLIKGIVLPIVYKKEHCHHLLTWHFFPNLYGFPSAELVLILSAILNFSKLISFV